MEKIDFREVLEENTKYKYSSIVNKIWAIIIVVAIFLIVHKLIDDKNSSIEKLKDEKMELSQKLYEYKINTLIQNKDVLTSYLTQHFKEMKEYRVVSLIQRGEYTILGVILDEPIKTTENDLGYKKSNWIDVITIVEPGKLEIKDFFPIISKEETKSEPVVVNKDSWFYKVQEFIPNQFSEFFIFMRETNVKINKMITQMNIDSIEKPILLVKIDNKQSLQDLEKIYLESGCADLKKNINETDESFNERASKCLSISALDGLYNLLKPFENSIKGQ